MLHHGSLACGRCPPRCPKAVRRLVAGALQQLLWRDRRWPGCIHSLLDYKWNLHSWIKKPPCGELGEASTVIHPHSARLCFTAEACQDAPSQCEAWESFGRFLSPMALWPCMVMEGPVGSTHRVTVALVSLFSSH